MSLLATMLRRRKVLGIIGALVGVASFRVSPVPAQATAGLTAVRDLYIAPETAGLSFAAFMAVSRDGVLAVAQPQDNAIRFFSSAGKQLGAIGRAGAGPGEFRSVGYVLWTADTLWVSDPALSRITLISPDRKVLGTAPLLTKATYQPGGGKGALTFSTLNPRARYPGGTMLFGAAGWERRRTEWLPRGHVRGEYPLIRVDPTGRVTDVIGFTPTDQECEEGSITIPFCAEPLEAYASDGSRMAFATVRGSSGGKGTYRVVALTQQGDTLFDRTYPYVPETVSRSAIDSARARRVKAALRPESRADAERMRIPTVYPPIRGLVVGRDGTVWVDLRAGSTERRWQVLAPDGRPIGVVAFPANVSLKVAQRDRVWGFVENEDGEQGIVSYTIRGGG